MTKRHPNEGDASGESLFRKRNIARRNRIACEARLDALERELTAKRHESEKAWEQGPPQAGDMPADYFDK